MPKEESFTVPLRYIDVTRATHTILDVLQESRIDYFWNIDGARNPSEAWTGFTKFTRLNANPPDGYTWSEKRLPKKQVTSRPDHLCQEIWSKMSKAAQRKEKQECAVEKPKLDNAKRLRDISSSIRKMKSSKRP